MKRFFDKATQRQAVAAALDASARVVATNPIGTCVPVRLHHGAARIKAHTWAAAIHNASPPNPTRTALVACNAEVGRGHTEIPELQQRRPEQ